MLGSIKSYVMSKKWLFFTMLTFLSAAGILVSMISINFMTKDVATQTYMEEHRLDKKLLDGFLISRYDSLLSIAGILSIHPEIAMHIEEKADNTLNELLQKVYKNINETVNNNPIKIKYYAKDYTASSSENTEIANLVMDSKQNITGIVINKDGVRLIGITAVEKDKKVIGAIEVSQSIHGIKDDFERLGKEFVFILDKSQLVFLDVAHKTDTYHDIDETYKVAFHEYDSKFYVNLQKLDINKLMEKKYINNKDFYTTNDFAIDLNGREIGLFVIGESTNNGSSFVQITKNMINSVTTVALGLVISLILFMF
jgi:hypothetical protein